MKKKLCLLITILLLFASAMAVCAEMNSPARVNKSFGKADIKEFDKTGLVEDFLPIKDKKDFRAGVTEEELPVDEETSVIFRYVCETGLNETEPGKGIETKLLQYSCRKTLLVLLKDKVSGEEEEIQRYVVNMYENSIWRLDSRKILYLNYPYVLDAVLSDDGKVLRYIFAMEPMNTELREFRLDEKDWGYQTRFKQYSEVVFRRLGQPYSGNLKQAFFITPDIIKVSSDNGMDYSVRITEKDAVMPSGLQDFNGKTLMKRMCLDCIYWNGAGKKEYLKTFFSKEPVFDNERNKYVMEAFIDKTLTAEPPVPTERDWEGWHKLERNIK